MNSLCFIIYFLLLKKYVLLITYFFYSYIFNCLSQSILGRSFELCQRKSSQIRESESKQIIQTTRLGNNQE